MYKKQTAHYVFSLSIKDCLRRHPVTYIYRIIVFSLLLSNVASAFVINARNASDPGVLPYMAFTGTCGPIGYGFLRVLS